MLFTQLSHDYEPKGTFVIKQSFLMNVEAVELEASLLFVVINIYLNSSVLGTQPICIKIISVNFRNMAINSRIFYQIFIYIFTIVFF